MPGEAKEENNMRIIITCEYLLTIYGMFNNKLQCVWGGEGRYKHRGMKHAPCPPEAGLTGYSNRYTNKNTNSIHL